MFNTDNSSDASCRVIIADDHPIILHGVRKILEADKSVSVVGTASSISATFDLLKAQFCDILICDYSFYGDAQPDGLRLIKKIRESYPDLKIIILSAREDFATARNSLKCGVHGFVRKHSNFNNVLSAVREVRMGNKYMDSMTAQDMLGHVLSLDKSRNHFSEEPTTFSPKETEIIRLLQRGLRLTEIADQTNRSIKTVSAQKQVIMRKLRVKNNMEFFNMINNEQLMSNFPGE
ncbi:MAG: DNA-binding response regulator [Herbaspirillum sp.]|nr:DNA-binding response regulator [Herbaspirillum sp.]